MVLDKKEHQAFLLELIKQMTFPGQVLETAYEVKKAVETAQVKDSTP